MTLSIRGSWHIDTKGSQASGLPPANDFKEVPIASSNLEDLIVATSELKKHINDQLTIWKDALEGKGDASNAKEEDEQLDDDDEEEEV